MKVIEKILRGNEETISKNTYIWNSISGLINASQAVIILIVATRTAGIESAGILTIGFALANLFMTIGKFGIRNFQITDVKAEYIFNIYFSSRIITVALMVSISLIYVLYMHLLGGYSLYKSFNIFIICMLYVVEAFEDSFIGEYQLKGRLDIGAKVFSLRWILVILSLCLFLIISCNLLLSLSVALFISFISLSILINNSNNILNLKNVNFTIKKVITLLHKCIPIAVSGFCSFYIINAPKYAIDIQLNDVIQACYGFIFMPIFMIGLLSSMLYMPTIVNIAEEYSNKNFNRIKFRIKKQLIILCIISSLCIIGAYFFGIPVLTLLFNTDLFKYKMELLILMAGSGFLAIAGYLGVILITMRLQRSMMFCYIFVAILAKIFSGFFVAKWYTIGAALINSILMIILSLLFITLIKYKWRSIVDPIVNTVA